MTKVLHTFKQDDGSLAVVLDDGRQMAEDKYLEELKPPDAKPPETPPPAK